MTGPAEAKGAFEPGKKRLGQWPEFTLATLADPGLSDAEIGRYLAIDPGSVVELRKKYRVRRHRRGL